MKARLGDAFPAFESAMQEQAVTSVRLNPAKPGATFDAAVEVPWCPHGRYLPERPVFTTDPLLHAGAYYVQEASSMAIWQAVQQSVPNLEQARMLDVCAAPGGKSTLLASCSGAEGLLVANEVIGSRASILRENLTKWGSANVMVTNNDPRDFYPLDGFFDCVLVDAPCSGEGLFRRDARAIGEWSEQNVALCSARQQRILSDVIGTVRPGGTLIYSTCTWEEAENEDVAAWLASQGFEPLALDMETTWGMQPTTGGGFRFYPHLVQGEGFYLLAMRKTGNRVSTDLAPKRRSKLQPVAANLQKELSSWLADPTAVQLLQREDDVYAFPKAQAEAMHGITDRMKVRKAGVLMGKIIRDALVPAHELALSHLCTNTIPALDLDHENALRYLRKDHLSPSLTNGSTGWMLARYKGLNLGWVKALPNRINNYYPKEWRIRMR